MTKLIHVESVETYLGATYRFYVRGVSFARRPPGPARWRPRGAGDLGLQDNANEAEPIK